ncbi:hypothetical protein KXJ72_17380 (plasmid) [Comamonas aquatica]|nr:hypothetical protein KXJ72_17380 [Comamonas aquatica]
MDKKTVYAVSVESPTSGAVDWYAHPDEADLEFDKAVSNFGHLPNHTITLYPLDVPYGLARLEITELVDDAMWELNYVATRVHKSHSTAQQG